MSRMKSYSRNVAHQRLLFAVPQHSAKIQEGTLVPWVSLAAMVYRPSPYPLTTNH